MSFIINKPPSLLPHSTILAYTYELITVNLCPVSISGTHYCMSVVLEYYKKRGKYQFEFVAF